MKKNKLINNLKEILKDKLLNLKEVQKGNHHCQNKIIPKGLALKEKKIQS